MFGSPIVGQFSPMSPAFNGGFGTPQSAGFPSPGFGMFIDPNLGNRNVYIGNLHPDITYEELLNHVRGGLVEKTRLIKDKGIAVSSIASNTRASPDPSLLCLSNPMSPSNSSSRSTGPASRSISAD